MPDDRIPHVELFLSIEALKRLITLPANTTFEYRTTRGHASIRVEALLEEKLYLWLKEREEYRDA